jgi:hypothetical protein
MANKKKKTIIGVQRSSFEKYEIEEIHREALKNAPYNPRTISAKAKKALKANLEKVGLLAPIIWNRRTGNIVSGHQRIAALDALEKSYDYLVKVAVVDLDEKTEKEQNIFMNNPEVMGTFELEGLEAMIKDHNLEIEGMGFDSGDIMNFFGEQALSNDDLADMSNKLHEMRDSFEKIKEKSVDRDSPNFYLVVIFKDYEGRKAFTDKIGVRDFRYLDGKILMEAVKG